MTKIPERNWLVRLAFDGREYHGTQIQANSPLTIQGIIEKRISALVGRKVRIATCSRLDAGVSALDFCVSFRLPARFGKEQLKDYLNKSTPESLRFRAVVAKPMAFDAKRTPHRKTYIYGLDNGLDNPLEARYLWRVGRPLDIPVLEKALALFTGLHDFASFAALDSKSDRTQTFMTEVTSAAVSSKGRGKKILIHIKGKAFFRYQVRFMVGAAVAAALGKTTLESIAARLERPDIQSEKYKAPAQGLILYRTVYLKKGKDYA